MIKILLMTEYFPPEIGAGSNRAYEHAKVWKNLGANVTILTGFPDYPSGIRPEKYQKLKYLEEEIDGIKVLRTFTYSTPNKGIIKRTFSYFSFMLSCVIQGPFKVKEADVIIASSPPITVGIAGAILSKIKKVPFVFEVRDLWPDSIIQLLNLKSKWLIKILCLIEMWIYNNASLIISVTDSFVKEITKKGIKSSKIKVIKNGINLSTFNPVPKCQKLVNDLNLEDKFVVSYFGTHGISHALNKVVSAAEKLRNNSDIMFIFIGDGAEKENLIEISKQKKMENIKFIRSVSIPELIEYYSISDLLLVPLRKIELFKTVIPSKIFEIMAMKKPILLSVEGESKAIIEDAGAGICIEPENHEEMAEKILELKDNEGRLIQMSNSGYHYVVKKFDREKLALEYLEIIEDIFYEQ